MFRFLLWPGALQTAVLSGIIMLAFSFVDVGARQQSTIRFFDELSRAVPQVATPVSRDVRLGWRTGAVVSTPGDTHHQFHLLSATVVVGAAPTQRRPAVDEHRLIVVSLDAAGRELDWRAIYDPRLLRHERRADDGTLIEGVNLYYTASELLVSVPHLPAATHLAIYGVRAIQGRAALDHLGTVPLPQSAR